MHFYAIESNYSHIPLHFSGHRVIIEMHLLIQGNLSYL